MTTIKEAILQSLSDLVNGATSFEVFQHIQKNHYYEFIKGKTPASTVSALLGDFITKGDTRVKRYKNEENVYCYYLSKNENYINSQNEENVAKKEKTSYHERDLHPLLCTFVKEYSIYTKTIFHEQSNKSEEYQKWIHPDIVGAKFIEFNNKTCHSFFKATNITNAVEIYSYELKREINSDYDLKKCFFQAVSNSSWANYGYLVAFSIGENLLNELERLNQSFGVGFILLKTNVYESQILFPAKYRDLDFKTIEKLCNVNTDFSNFFEQVEKVITANTKYANDVKQGLKLMCDEVFRDETDCKKYCKTKGIPLMDTED